MPNDRPHVPRFAILVAVVMAIGGGAMAISAAAADPGTGEVSLDQLTAGWNGDQNYTAATVVRDACALPTDTVCDHFTLTVDIPKSHWDANKGGVDVQIKPVAESDADFDLTVNDKDGNEVGSSLNAGTTNERVFIDHANSEDGPYEVKVNPYTVVNSNYMGGARVESRADATDDSVPTEPVSNLACTDGNAGPFPCKDIDLKGFLPLGSLSVDGTPAELNDIWGWTDPQTGREYALVGKTDGTAFVDVTDASAPRLVGELPSAQAEETIFNIWRDIKVYKDHAFVVSEEPTHGMQVFDLTRLRGVTEPQTFDEDAHYSYVLDGPESILDPPPVDPGDPPLLTLDNAHNIAINEESGTAYAVGTSTCAGGGPHMIDISDPEAPEFAGCVSEDSYTHDTQCVNYRDSDPDGAQFGGREICFSSNEDSLTIVDVTDKSNPVEIVRKEYDGSAYSHQGWLTEDRRFFLLGDELDETDNGFEKTRTYVFNVERLSLPSDPAVYEAPEESIDHNMYTKGQRMYQANYRSGLRILDNSQLAEGGAPTEEAFFDIYPADDAAEFNGAWSNYPYLPSGNVVVSGIEEGLFVLRPDSADPEAESGAPTDADPVAAANCAAAASRARRKRIGQARLGRKRAAVRKAFGSRGTYRRFTDRFCLSDGAALRVGYTSRKALKRLPQAERKRLRGRARFVLTSSTNTKLRGVTVGMKRRALLKRIGKGRGVRVGRNVWFARRGSRARQLFRLRRGRVREVGLADLERTRGRRAVKRFLRAGR